MSDDSPKFEDAAESFDEPQLVGVAEADTRALTSGATSDPTQERQKDTIEEPVVAQETSSTTSATLPPAAEPTTTNDILMPDAPTGDNAPSPAPAVQVSTPRVASPMPRTNTPSRAVNGTHDKEPGSSRAGSAHPDPGFTMPDKAASHGDPVRQYLNNNVTATLLEGMKQIAKDKPKDPLRVLGNYLIQRSKELEQQGEN
ncbi:hypothetical protein ACHAQA_003996 [Verticillium albo-atrum]